MLQWLKGKQKLPHPCPSPRGRGDKVTRLLVTAGAVMLLLACGLALKTWLDLGPLPATLALDPTDIRKVQIRDRHGVPLSVTYQNDFNYHDYALLHEIPRLYEAQKHGAIFFA